MFSINVQFGLWATLRFCSVGTKRYTEFPTQSHSYKMVLPYKSCLNFNMNFATFFGKKKHKTKRKQTLLYVARRRTQQSKSANARSVINTEKLRKVKIWCRYQWSEVGRYFRNSYTCSDYALSHTNRTEIPRKEMSMSLSNDRTNDQ